jgi:predicted metal-dependent hydrolase
MMQQLDLGEICVDVVFKDIKNVHLSVYPPTGRVRISAPERMSIDTIRAFAISKISWIKKHQVELVNQERETPREYLDRESHYLWGKRYLLQISEHDSPPEVQIASSQIILRIRPHTSDKQKQEILSQFYRMRMREEITQLITKWEPLMGVTVHKFYVQHMKTMWGSCNHHAKTVRLNTELAKKPKECLEYILVHEMAHIIEPTHNARFIALIDQFLPNWQVRKNILNQLPLGYEEWVY